MNGFTATIERVFLPMANKVNNQRHLAAIRDGFIAGMPLALAGALAAMFNNVFLLPWSLVGELLNRMAWYHESVQPFLSETLIPIFDQIWWGGVGLSVITTIFAIAYNLAKKLGEEEALIPGMVAVICYVVLTPQSQSFNIAGAIYEHSGVYMAEAVYQSFWGVLSWNSFNSQAIFAGLITALLTTELFCWLKSKGLIIKMPDGVPPAVSKAFSAVLPAGISLFVVAAVSVFFLRVLNAPFQVWINELLQAPLVRLGQSPISLIFLMTLSQFLWFFGVHGMLIVEPALGLMYGPAGAANQELVMQGLEPAYAITRNFIDVYGMHGGSGATLGLIVAIFIVGKKPHHRALAKMSLAPGIFQINEPMIFGLPLVLNPIMAIPFILVPAITIAIAWFFTAVVPFAGYLWTGGPWTTPPVISAFLASGGDIGATILAAGTFVLSIALYIPFVILANKEKSPDEE
ncbi:MAG: PTS transporter subunit EIIC [Turicibacter sp.]|nr:PTS transporter subunit EIIC [Turicibacter sp.]